MPRKHFSDFGKPSAQAVRRVSAGLDRPKTTGVFCEHCETWVKARRYNPDLYCCKRCQTVFTQGRFSEHRTRLQVAELAHHLHMKRTREWRRRTARTAAFADR